MHSIFHPSFFFVVNAIFLAREIETLAAAGTPTNLSKSVKLVTKYSSSKHSI